MLHYTRFALFAAAISFTSLACTAQIEDGTESSSGEDDLTAVADELSTTGPVYEENTELFTAANLNLRDEAATDGTVLAIIPRGTKLIVTRQSGANAWVAVRYDGQEGFAHTDYLMENEDGDDGPGDADDVDCNGGQQKAYENGSSIGNMQLMRIGNKVTTYKTGHAFLELREKMAAAGVAISINSGFRTQAEQQYFYNCYVNRNCNNGNLAARPGYSNHQNGRALDLAISNHSKFRSELRRLGLSDSWRATVASERWHWEYFGRDPGGVCE